MKTTKKLYHTVGTIQISKNQNQNCRKRQNRYH